MLLRRKLEGQRRIAVHLGATEGVGVIDIAVRALDVATTPAELMVPEAAAANAYWAAWSNLAVRWARADLQRVPPHWMRFGLRASPMTGNPRLAANPPNAMLNYLYGILEAEARIALLSVGLDPGLGILHADLRARDSLALDLMEAVRPEVDELVLGMLQTRHFRWSDFVETRQGACRLLAPLSHELASTARMLASRVAPVAESIARAFADAPESTVTRLATPLTQSRRSAGRPTAWRATREALVTPNRPVATCLECGERVVPARKYCVVCRPDIGAFQAAGSDRLARLRQAGEDPAHGGDAALIRGAKWRQRRQVEADWEREHGRPDPAAFAAEILPNLRALATRQIVEATGMTRAYCSRIRRGELVPHPRHWATLRQLGDAAVR